MEVSKMSAHNHLPRTVEASLDARLSPFHVDEPALRDKGLGDETPRTVSPQHDRKLRLRLVNDLKLLFAALGAGGSVVPLGDNGRTTRFLAQYAESLRDH
jgi:hypothetical protein